VYETYVSNKLNAYRGAISVARSMIPGSREDVDRTSEETIMRDSKVVLVERGFPESLETMLLINVGS